MLTTPALIQFLQLREGFRKNAYDDKKPKVVLTAETEIEGTLTIGYGTTVYPDGRPVEWNDKVTKSEAVDYLAHYVRETIEPALENLIHVPLAGCQYNAVGSCIYQYGEGEVAGWNLIRLINGGAEWEDIALEWVNGTVFWNKNRELGPIFWGRRIMELFMYLGLDFRAGQNVPTLSNPVAAAEAMGFDGELPKPEPIVHEDLFEELEIPRQGAPVTKKRTIELPDNWDELSPNQQTAWLNGDQRAALADEPTPKVAVTAVTPKVPVKAYEYLSNDQKENLQVKDVGKAQRGRAVGKRAVSKGAGAAGIGGVVTIATGTAEPVLKIVDKYPKETLAYVSVVLIVVGIIWHFWSEWQLQKGRDDADTLLG